MHVKIVLIIYRMMRIVNYSEVTVIKLVSAPIRVKVRDRIHPVSQNHMYAGNK